MQIIINIPDSIQLKDIPDFLRFEANKLDGIKGKDAAKTDTAPELADEVKVAEPEAAKLLGKRAAKKEKVVEETFDLGFEESEADDKEEDVKGPSLEDVIAGFKNFAQKKGRDKAGKVLAKYKVKSVNDLPESSYAKVLKEIEV